MTVTIAEINRVHLESFGLGIALEKNFNHQIAFFEFTSDVGISIREATGQIRTKVEYEAIFFSCPNEHGNVNARGVVFRFNNVDNDNRVFHVLVAKCARRVVQFT